MDAKQKLAAVAREESTIWMASLVVTAAGSPFFSASVEFPGDRRQLVVVAAYKSGECLNQSC
jgi:hypothetical protein